jgi:hypothetical protein
MKLTVFNGSPRGRGSNTRILLEHFVHGFESAPGNTSELFYLNRVSDSERFVQAFSDAEYVLLAHPLYTDCMPGVVMAFIEALEPLCGREGNPAIGFIVQSGFGEAAHSRYVERYQVKLAARLGCTYMGTVVRGNCEGVRLQPKMYRKVFDGFHRLGLAFGETGQFDEALVRKVAGPETFGAPTRLLLGLMVKSGLGTALWDKPLKENGVYEERSARPYVE